MISLRYLRFSLLSLLLLTTLAAMSVSHWLASRELSKSTAKLAEQHKQIRDLSHRLGILTEEDLPYVQVQRVLRERDGSIPIEEWLRRVEASWLVHLPTHSKWRLHWASGNIPKEGLPAEIAGSRDLPPQENQWSSLSISFEQNRILGWAAKFTYEGETWDYWIPYDSSQWLEPESHTDGYYAGPWSCYTGETFIAQFACDKPVILLVERQEILIEEGSRFVVTDTAPNPCQGFMIWLEAVADEEKPSAAAGAGGR
jgi:hypothetical protein